MTDIFMYIVVLLGIILGSALLVAIFVNVLDMIILKCRTAIRRCRRKRKGKI